jgi:hypothetical protein
MGKQFYGQLAVDILIVLVTVNYEKTFMLLMAT